MWPLEDLMVFHNKINIWDVAAGALMVEEAGGIVNEINNFDVKNMKSELQVVQLTIKCLKN